LPNQIPNLVKKKKSKKMAFQGPSTPKGQIQRENRMATSPNSTKSRFETPNRFQIFENQKILKIRKARRLLQEALEIEDFQANDYILSGIQNLEYIEEWIQNPHLPTPEEKKQDTCQVQKELGIINQKLNYIQEEMKIQRSQLQVQSQLQAQPQLQSQFQPQTQPQSQAQAQAQAQTQTQEFNKAFTYAENLRKNQGIPNGINSNLSLIRNQAQSLPPVPQVVIPRRKDLIQSSKTQSQVETRARRLILKVPLQFLEEFNPRRVRDQINDSFFEKGYNSPIVTMVSKSATNLSIVITTMEGIAATFLMENKEIWQSNIPFSKAIYDKEWYKLVVHTIPVRPFNMDDGLEILKSEIETFNLGIKLARNPIWLANEEKRDQKRHSSILIHLEDKEMADKIQKTRIYVGGTSCRVQKFIPRHTQCEKCYQYGHSRPNCHQEANCPICAQNHEEYEHNCNICEVSGQECPHTLVKCSNCGENHKANDKKCKEWIKVRPTFIKPKIRLNPREQRNSNSNSSPIASIMSSPTPMPRPDLDIESDSESDQNQWDDPNYISQKEKETKMNTQW
jgi:hypothetical protein